LLTFWTLSSALLFSECFAVVVALLDSASVLGGVVVSFCATLLLLLDF